jgi:photosystem II stability/assembly factor-like uncharacterized protein
MLGLFLVNAPMAAEAWTKLNTGTTCLFRSICFTSPDVGYVAGDSGYVFKTVDAGLHWTKLTTGTSLFLYKICFPTPDTGYAAANNGPGNIIRTTNAGQTWDTLHTGFPSMSFEAIGFCNSRIGFAAGSSETIIRTADGGDTWTLRPRLGVSAGALQEVFGVDSNIAFVTGGNGRIFKTVNGGLDWTYTYVANWTSSIFFITPKIGYVVGNYGSIYKSIDSGATWVKYSSPVNNDWYTSVWFTDTNNGYAAGGTKIMRTQNAGAAWDSMETGMTGVAFYSLFFTTKQTSCFSSIKTGYLAGTKGTILKLTTSTPTAPIMRKESQHSFLAIKSDVLTYRANVRGVLSVYTMGGRLMSSRRVLAGGKMDVGRFPRGLYLAKLHCGESIITRTLLLY